MSFPLSSKFPRQSDLIEEEEVQEQEPKDTVWQKQRAKELKNRKAVKDAVTEYYSIVPKNSNEKQEKSNKK